ncbi:PIG-L deacetylase family protein [Flagellimonas okinawensis]|uniref:PIG-L family deacetylase n=1 Tax=Flagellimonas okinawensis TaxID=3031324 RepID=A0ABT5XSY1_9FLAO|nr:PIG-L family deacetylase [[Muricauda] okinawensis]MDF0709023.1 PIG-L family deacetylase [[Muricauda] okinawensis]
MRKLIMALCLCFAFTTLQAQQKKVLNILAIGAHPDDCDSKFGGTAALFAKMGHNVKFLALTNGDAGHYAMGGGVLAKKRRQEAKDAAKALGIAEYEVLDNHDGELFPTLNVRLEVIRRIRDWDADIVLGLRPNDYHPDHRNAGSVVQDAAYMNIVPNVAPDTPPLKKNPVFLYMSDHFQKPYPFQKDIAVIIDDVIDTKVKGLAAHDSQMFEWLPWTNGVDVSTIPTGEQERLVWLKEKWMNRTADASTLEAVKKWYPKADLSKVKHVEYFEICEYGKQPTEEEIKAMFPMLGAN